MAERLDVAGRLAEGWVAVEHTQRYVRACHALGYDQPDLTSHPSRIRDWYDSEDGLDLRALDEDCAQLRAAGAAATEVLRMLHAQLTELATAWMGPGADSALRLLERHCDAASGVANELRAAAQRCESLRDNLWFLVDSKAATAIAIDDRTLAQRSVWLAAADTVAGGTHDRATAEEVVRRQMTPYVDNDIRGEWLDTMRSTVSGMAASYDMVIDRMAATPPAQFEFPGDLGPSGPALPSAGSRPPVTPAPVTPAAALAGPPADAAPTGNPSAPSPTQSLPTPAVPDLGTALGDVPSMPDVGGDPGGAGGGLGGLSGLGALANRIVDAMGELLGSATDPLGDPSAFGDDASSGDAVDANAVGPDNENTKDDDRSDAQTDDPYQPESADEPNVAEAAAPVNAPPTAEAPAPTEAPPPVAPPADQPAPPAAVPASPSAPPASGPSPEPPHGSTPCEIAADALPQAGQ